MYVGGEGREMAQAFRLGVRRFAGGVGWGEGAPWLTTTVRLLIHIHMHMKK